MHFHEFVYKAPQSPSKYNWINFYLEIETKKNQNRINDKAALFSDVIQVQNFAII